MKLVTSAKNNEEYRIVVKRRIKFSFLLDLLGIFTIVLSLAARLWWEVPISDHMLGFYNGAGFGVLMLGIFTYIKNRRLLSNEERLKADRLSRTDERLQKISQKAYHTAGKIVLVGAYIIIFVGGLFYPALTQIFGITIAAFCIIYTIAYYYYNHKM